MRRIIKLAASVNHFTAALLQISTLLDVRKCDCVCIEIQGKHKLGHYERLNNRTTKLTVTCVYTCVCVSMLAPKKIDHTQAWQTQTNSWIVILHFYLFILNTDQ